MPNTNFRDDGRKKTYNMANHQSRNEKHVKPVKAISYSIKPANFNALTMMKCVLFVQYTQPKNRDLSKKKKRILLDVDYFYENIVYHYPTSVYIFLQVP